MSVKNEDIILSFDLDFTLIINREGILNSFKYAFNKYDLPIIDDRALVKTIGVPFKYVMKAYDSLTADYMRKHGNKR